MSAEYQLLSPHYSFTLVKLVSPLVSRNVLPVTFSFFHQKLAVGWGLFWLWIPLKYLIQIYYQAIFLNHFFGSMTSFFVQFITDCISNPCNKHIDKSMISCRYTILFLLILSICLSDVYIGIVLFISCNFAIEITSNAHACSGEWIALVEWLMY